MNIGLTFFGAAQNVTGSCYLVQANGKRFIVDCGLYQERNLKHRNWEPFPVPPKTLDGVLLTHAHLDHCGLLPKLFREGFQGPIYCTSATADIARIVLMDSAKIQTEDAAHKKKRHKRENRKGRHPEIPLYTVEDAQAVLPHFAEVGYGEVLELGDGLTGSFHDAGHILGSAMIRLIVRQNGEERTVLFSGDIGRWDTPILRDPTCFDEADYVVVESTYGNREHKDNSTIPGSLTRIITETHRSGGNILVPSFAVERTQELLYHLSSLFGKKRIPQLPVFVDSPMAIRVTEIFKRHPELFDEEMIEIIRRGRHPCDFPGLKMARTTNESKAINEYDGSSIIIAGSGMCTGGRIKYHIKHNIENPASILVFVGYQAVGTMGRQMLEGADAVRIHGRTRPVRMRVTKVNGFSAHADRSELFRWLLSLKRPPRHLFVTHGEPESADAFASYVKDNRGWPVSVATHMQDVSLN